MHFALTEDQRMIRDAAESFLADASDSAAVRRALASDLGYDESVWRRIAGELGWCGTAIGEAHGGLGLSPVELALIQEQCGRRLLCAPLFGTACVAAPVLQQLGEAGAQQRLLPAIAGGGARVSLPLLSSHEEWIASATGVRARRVGAGLQLDGRVTRMVDVTAAEWLFVFARLPEGGLGLFAVERGEPGVSVRALNGWDATRRLGEVELRGAVAAVRIDDPARFAEGLPRAAALARLYLAAEQLGGAQACLDLTVAYCGTRKQFGRAIASFQAVKHRCAEMMVRVESLRSAVYGAAALAASEPATPQLEIECAMARALAADTYFFCAQEAIQLHGGVGFTWEYDPQLHFKRAQAGSHWFGTADALREQIAAQLLDGASPAAAKSRAMEQADAA